MAPIRRNGKSKHPAACLVRRIRRLTGAGLYLLLPGLILEGLALAVEEQVSFPISLALETQILLTVLCLGACFLDVIWFNRTLNLVRVHLLNGKSELVSGGPFAYVRHPLYATLLITIPPLAVVWHSDLLFVLPWVLAVALAHPLVRLEERALLRQFGQDYERYIKFVPALLPYMGDGGKRYRGEESQPLLGRS